MNLTEPEVDGIQTERRVLGLFREFLGNYFDGGAHDVGVYKALSFPKARIVFQQADPQMSEALIHMVWIKPGRIDRAWESVEGKMERVKRGRCAWTFFVKVKKQPDANGGSKDLAMQVSGLLSALLGNTNCVLALNKKGIAKIRVDLPSLISDGSQYQVRQVPCAGEVWWREGWTGSKG